MIKTLVLLLSLAAGSLPAVSQQAQVLVTERKDAGRVYLSARNSDMMLARWVQVGFEQSDNIVLDRGLPLRALLQPGEMKELAVISPADPHRGYSYGIRYGEGIGNPDAMPDLSVPYLLPFEHGSKHAIGQGYLGQATHQGLYALDFDMPEGTTICAARDGVVAALKDDSDMGGASPAFARLGNTIDILHRDGTWATYAHLKHRGGLVREGDRVRAGDPIALSGQTGQASGPHLHFSVQKPRWSGEPETFATLFAIDASHNAFLEEGKYYYSWHPGGPPFARVDAAALDESALEGKIKPAAGGKPRFREEKIDNRVLLFFVNPSALRLELTVEFSRSQGVTPSKPLPFIKNIPARSEVFLFSVLMKGGSSYGIRSKIRTLNEP